MMSGWLAAVGILVVTYGTVAQMADREQAPVADAFDLQHAPLAISRDGRTITIRGAASDDLRICVEPKAGVFGSVRCYLVRDLRRGAK